MIVRTGRDGTEESRSYHCPEYTLQLHNDIRVFLLQSVLFDELGELAEMPFLVKHLAPELSLSHHPVEVGRNDPIERTRMDDEKNLSAV